MFAKTIIDSDSFLDMPLSAQALYFHLSMRADDDGFVNNPKRIQRVVGCNDDDFNVLVAKRFILTFESGVIVIKHWRIHNYIRGDRKHDTTYRDEMALLEVKDNGAYSFNSGLKEIGCDDEPDVKPMTMRQKAYAESSLPYSFEYKIRQAFWGKQCPICGIQMRDSIDSSGVADDMHRPSIQHNIPISKGGKHELGNISVICHHCNVTIQDKETGRLNADEVIEVWDSLSNVRQMSVKCPSSDYIGKDRLGEDRLGEDKKEKKGGRFTPPSLEELSEYIKEKGYAVDPEAFIDFYTSKGWKIGKETMKDWKAAVRTWARRDNHTEPKKPEQKPSTGGMAKDNKFMDYDQRDYDFDALEKMLTAN